MTVRFIVVGLVATATYALSTLTLNDERTELDPVLANALGIAVSVLVSYLGHHRYTFGLAGRHAFYFPRFIFVTSGLFVLSCTVTYIATHRYSVSPVAVTLAISILYPLASYLFSSLWTFRLQPSEDDSRTEHERIAGRRPRVVGVLRFGTAPGSTCQMAVKLREIAIYSIGVALAFGADFALLAGFVEVVGLHYLMAAALSFLAGTAIAYWVSINFAFAYRRVANGRQEFAIFAAIGVAGLVVNLAGLYVAVEKLQLHYLAGKALSGVLTFVMNFALRRLLLFTPLYRSSERCGAGAQLPPTHDS